MTDHATDDQTAGGSRLHDATAAVRDKVGEALGAAREKTSAVYSVAADRAGDAYGSARERAGDAYGAARDRASQARRATAEGVDDNPFVAILGGIAVGALIGALLPRTQREDEALGPIAERLGDAARAAVFAARDAGKQSLDELGVNREAALGKVDQFVDGAVKAASSAGNAAADAVRKTS